jgi:hypothetical protein
MAIEMGLLFAAVACAIGVAGYLSGKQNAAKNDGHSWGAFTAEIKTDIEYIKSDIGEIKASIRENDHELKESIRRVHARIDEHERHFHSKPARAEE